MKLYKAHRPLISTMLAARIRSCSGWIRTPRNRTPLPSISGLVNRMPVPHRRTAKVSINVATANVPTSGRIRGASRRGRATVTSVAAPRATATMRAAGRAMVSPRSLDDSAECPKRISA